MAWRRCTARSVSGNAGVFVNREGFLCRYLIAASCSGHWSLSRMKVGMFFCTEVQDSESAKSLVFSSSSKAVNSILEPLVERSSLEYQDSLELVWTKVRDVRGPRVVPYLNWLVEMEEVSSKAMILAIIRRLRKKGRHRIALEVVNWLVSQKYFELDDRDYVMQIDYQALVDMYIAEMLFYRLDPEKRTQEAYNYLLSGFARNNMLEKAMELMEKIRELNLVSRFALEQMTLLFNELRLDRRIPALLVEARSLGIHLHPHFLNTYLRIQRKQGDLEGMEKTVEELESSRKSNAWTYVFMATAYVKFGFDDKASAALGAAEAGIKNGRFKKERRLYNRMLKIYGLIKDMDGIERVWEIVNRRPLVAMHNYLFMIEALGNAGNVKRAEAIFKELKKFCGELKEHRQFVVMIGAYTKNGLMEKADQLMLEMPVKKKLRPATELYHHFIKGYIKRNEKDWAIEAFEEGQCVVKHRSNKLWYETMLAVMGIYAERGDINGALGVFKHCKSCKYNDIRMFILLLKTFLTAEVPAHGVIQRMLLMGFEPNDEVRELVRQLRPIGDKFYKDRFERKIFGKPGLQWLRLADPDVQKKWFRRGLNKRVRKLYFQVKHRYQRKLRVWSSSTTDHEEINMV